MRRLVFPLLLMIAFGCEPQTSSNGDSKITGTISSFSVKAITGPQKDKSLCYI